MLDAQAAMVHWRIASVESAALAFGQQLHSLFQLQLMQLAKGLGQDKIADLAHG